VTRPNLASALVDATPSRSHLVLLLHTGMGNKRIAAACGVSPTCVRGILYGRPERGCPPCRRVNQATETRILAARPEFAPRQLIPAHEVWAMIADLMALGYSAAWIAVNIGNTRQLQIDRCNVEVATAAKILRLWERTTEPRSEVTHHDRTAATRARKGAAEVRSWLARPRGPHAAPTVRTGQGRRRVAV
jgi:hypothetical protein